MAEKLSEDYANYFLKNNIAKEVPPIAITIDNIQTRISEIENVFLPTIRHDQEITSENISQILQCKPQFDFICSKIDNLEMCIERVKSDLDNLERQVEIADRELEIPSKTAPLKFLKSLKLFSKPEVQGTNLGADGRYEPVEIFKAESFFNEKTES